MSRQREDYLYQYYCPKTREEDALIYGEYKGKSISTSRREVFRKKHSAKIRWVARDCTRSCPWIMGGGCKLRRKKKEGGGESVARKGETSEREQSRRKRAIRRQSNSKEAA